MSPVPPHSGIERVMMAVVNDDDTATYRRYATELVRYATALVGPSDAQDVVSDAVIAAFTAPAWPLVEDRRAYLYRAVLSRARMRERSAARRRRREARVAVSGWVSATESSLDAQQALARLSRQQRAVVYLTYWDDLAPAQIAALLGIGEGTVRKQLARGREQLRKGVEHGR